MDDVALAESGAFAVEPSNVFVVGEDIQVLAQPAVLVADTLAECGPGLAGALERFTDRRRFDLQSRTAREVAVRPTQQHRPLAHSAPPTPVNPPSQPAR